MIKFDKYSVLILCLFLALIGARVFKMTADPPAALSWSGGLFFDEGALAHNARNWVLFGEWETDEWNDFYYSPILSYIKLAVFEVCGVGMWQLRLVSLFFTAGTLILIYFSLKISQSRIVAASGMVLLGGNYLYLMYSRLGLTEISVVFLMVLTLYCWLKGMAATSAKAGIGWMAAAGSSVFMVFIFKTLMVYFLPVPFAALALLWLFPDAYRTRKRLAGQFGACLLGMTVTAGLWLWLFYLPNYEPIHQAGDFVKMLSLPGSPGKFLENVIRSPFFDIFLQTPIQLGLTLGYFVYILYCLLYDRQHLSPLDVFAGFWFLAHLMFFLGYSYRPTRYFVPMLPAISLLAARAVAWLLNQQTRQNGVIRLSLWFWFGAWVLTTIAIGSVVIPWADQYNVLEWITRSPIPDMTALAAGAVIALAGMLVAHWRIQRRPATVGTFLPPRFASSAAAVLLAACVLLHGSLYAQWAQNARFTVRDISRELGRILDHAYIAGLPSPVLCMENTHRALYVWENFTNDEAPFQTYPITHLILGEFNDETGYYRRKFPEVMQRARFLKTYDIRNSPFHLFSLIEPSIERVNMTQETYAADEPVQMRLEIMNNDRHEARVIEAGMLLFPEDSAVPAARAAERHEVAPQARQEFRLSHQVKPGRYQALAAILPDQHDVFEAEALPSQGGSVVTDPEASNRSARSAPADFAGFLTFGPYQQYPAGYAVVDFRLRYAEAPDDAALPVVSVDVVTDAGQTMLAQKALTVAELGEPGGYRSIHLPLVLKQPRILEFRIAALGQVAIQADVINVSSLPGTWYHSPISVE